MSFTGIIPSNIDLSSFDDKTRNKLIMILMVLWKSNENRKWRRKDNSYWYRIPISSKHWRLLIGGDYKKYLDILINMNVVAVNNSYSDGGYTDSRPKSYWLCQGYRKNSSYVAIDEKTALCLDKYAKNQFDALNKDTRNDKLKYVYQYLEKCVRERTSINIPFDKLNEVRDWNLTYNGVVVRKYRKSTIDNIGVDDMYMRNLQDKICLWSTISKTTHRFYSPVTQMCRALRTYLTGDDDYLINIDMKNSQPYFILLSALKKYGMKPDLQRYIHIIENANTDLYSHLGNAININDRNEFKNLYLWKSLFGPLRKDDKLILYIESDCPTLYKYIYDMKKGFSFKKEDYSRLSIEAQRNEANIMLGEIAYRIICEKPNIYLTTIHDSIMVHKENVPFVKTIIEEEFDKYGLRPYINI